MGKTFLILGGYGNTGILISEFLLKNTDSKLILAGRNLEKAKKITKSLNEKFFDERVTALRIDAAEKKSLVKKFQSADMVIVASSTLQYINNIAEAAIEAGIDYVDIQLSSEKKIQTLRSLEDRIKEKKLLFITDCGLHPGIPAALVHYAATQLDTIETANVASLIRMNWKELEFSESTVTEMADEFRNYKPLVYLDNRWKRLRHKNYKKFDFDNEFRRITCAPLMLEEMRNLPIKYPTIRELGNHVTGFNPFVDYFVIPVGTVASKILPGFTNKVFGRALAHGLKKFNSSPYQTMLLLSAVGRKGALTKEFKAKLSHVHGYWFTAASVTALLFQYLRGNFKDCGLFLQGNLVNPEVFLKDLERLGVNIKVYN
ncbi:MAG: saccharopine dehydrogenase NADP-binding domain-containing protein [Ignavibacteriaceae bacterium]|nr:saccharopine dehydrogenase NADP-binding domain-containing protein [Ignavibacteriaceae bacterium]